MDLGIEFKQLFLLFVEKGAEKVEQLIQLFLRAGEIFGGEREHRDDAHP